jgi:hypothetical protein
MRRTPDALREAASLTREVRTMWRKKKEKPPPCECGLATCLECMRRSRKAEKKARSDERLAAYKADAERAAAVRSRAREAEKARAAFMQTAEYREIRRVQRRREREANTLTGEDVKDFISRWW